MPKNTLIVIGILVSVLPFLGLPGSWKTPLYFLLGLGIAVVAYQQQYRKKFHFSRSAPRRPVRQSFNGGGSRSILNQTREEQTDDPSLAEPFDDSLPKTREEVPPKNP